LLDVTMISRGKLQLRTEACDAHSLIGLAVEIVRNDVREKRISLERIFQAKHSGLVADPARFQQVIWNLLRNAVKFTPLYGRITLTTRDEIDAEGEPWLRIEVKDSGRGIDATLLEKIFVPFEQGTVAGQQRFGGLGLGLAIARAVVGLHGGRITAESDGPNQGSTFIIELPSAIDPPAGISDPTFRSFVGDQPPLDPAPVLPLRLLLVEDHDSTLQTIAQLLTRAGHDVVAVSTIEAALAAANDGRFDLVISDLGLPDGTGNELMEQLRDLHGLRGIALSGYGSEEDIERSSDAGFVTHLVKPVTFVQLRHAIAEFAVGLENLSKVNGQRVT
ncbi:MAG: hypothetical protein JWM35_194, partial [Verrucomicrobia bacterium]|nr:hypothetical protein [Verrucomicrobiota bacterium]